MHNIGTLDDQYIILKENDPGRSTENYLARHNQTQVDYLISIKNLSICFKNIYCKISIKKIFLHKYLLYSRIIQDQ